MRGPSAPAEFAPLPARHPSRSSGRRRPRGDGGVKRGACRAHYIDRRLDWSIFHKGGRRRPRRDGNRCRERKGPRRQPPSRRPSPCPRGVGWACPTRPRSQRIPALCTSGSLRQWLLAPSAVDAIIPVFTGDRFMHSPRPEGHHNDRRLTAVVPILSGGDSGFVVAFRSWQALRPIRQGPA